jgi:hypothetical protein
MKAEDVPLTKYNYPTYLRAGANFPRNQCLVRTGVRRDDGLVVVWGTFYAAASHNNIVSRRNDLRDSYSSCC